MIDIIASFALAILPGLYAVFMLKTGETLQWSWTRGQLTRASNPYQYWANVVSAILISLFLVGCGFYACIS